MTEEKPYMFVVNVKVSSSELEWERYYVCTEEPNEGAIREASRNLFPDAECEITWYRSRVIKSGTQIAVYAAHELAMVSGRDPNEVPAVIPDPNSARLNALEREVKGMSNMLGRLLQRLDDSGTRKLAEVHREADEIREVAQRPSRRGPMPDAMASLERDRDQHGSIKMNLSGPAPTSQIFTVDPTEIDERDGGPKMISQPLPRAGNTLKSGVVRLPEE